MAAAPDGAVELELTRVFAAPRRLVFRMWTAPEHAARWWGPAGFMTLACTMDVRPGGAWTRHVRALDGSDRHCRGVYREIVEPERLSFTYRWDHEDGPETLVTVTFAERGAGTRMTLRQTGFSTPAARDRHETGWAGCFDRFLAHLQQVP